MCIIYSFPHPDADPFGNLINELQSYITSHARFVRRTEEALELIRQRRSIASDM